MAAAYIYADGGPLSTELSLSQQINRFGTYAVMGRPLYAKEINRLMMSENIVRLYQERLNSPNWAAWASENPDGSALLNYCAELVNGIDS